MRAAPSTLAVGDRDVPHPPARAARRRRRRAAAVHAARPARERRCARGDEDGARAVATWDADAEPAHEISFAPARVLLQDFTGVPAVVDLAAMRDAIAELGGDPARINPLIPAELVIDHSVQVDVFASRFAFARNVELEFERNRERYAFLRWGQRAFRDFKVVPPGTGICHQVNLEYLARVVEDRDGVAFPDTVVGTDSHTTMVNGLGVLGWGVGGIEAEAAMLGEPLSMLVPQVVGFRLLGRLREGATATDLVLTVTELLRKTGVVGKFVEYFGDGLAGLSVADRATLGNMSPEYGATCGFFPVDELTLDYLRLTGRPRRADRARRGVLQGEPALARAGRRTRRTRRSSSSTSATVEPSLAGPAPAAGPRAARPREGVVPRGARHVRRRSGRRRRARRDVPGERPDDRAGAGRPSEPEHGRPVAVAPAGRRPPRPRLARRRASSTLDHGAVVIAAITSCTNTSNPQVMIGAGLLAKKAVELGLRRRPWVKSSLAPGSRVVTDYYERAGLQTYLDELGFNTVGYGCTTCIGNSGPLPDEVSAAIAEGDLVACAVLSGNRNFEARIHPEVKANYLASPPLVVAYALAGRMDVDLETRAARAGLRTARDVFLRDVWPTLGRDRGDGRARRSHGEMFTTHLRRRLHRRRGLAQPARARRRPLRLGAGLDVRAPADATSRACRASRAPSPTSRARAASSCSATRSRPTTSRRPARSSADSPAGHYLVEHGVEPARLQLVRRAARQPRGDGARHVRERPPAEPARAGLGGDVDGARPVGRGDDDLRRVASATSAEGTPLVVIAGKEYGSGSSRDWAAKGPLLLGVRAVIAESYERIHRSNLLMMGILPLQFLPGEGREIARPDRPRGVRDPRRRERRGARGDGARRRPRVPRDRPPRHAARARVPPPRRHPAVRRAQARELLALAAALR